MDALNTLRAVLVAVTGVAAILLAFRGEWVPVGVLTAGILAHLALFAYLRLERRRTDHELEQLLSGS